MFWHLGKPETLNGFGVRRVDLHKIKRQSSIAVLDDEPFVRTEQLRTHEFQITELGGDIKSVSQIESYPVVICDVRGVGRSFGSAAEGAHVLSEIKKAYPDKYLIAYTGMTYSLAITEKLAEAADKIMPKDAPIDAWVQLLETALYEISDPRRRWVRLRSTLLDKNVDIFDVLKLEQAYVKAIKQATPELLSGKAKTLALSDEAKELVVKFAAAALVQLIESLAH